MQNTLTGPNGPLRGNEGRKSPQKSIGADGREYRVGRKKTAQKRKQPKSKAPAPRYVQDDYAEYDEPTTASTSIPDNEPPYDSMDAQQSTLHHLHEVAVSLRLLGMNEHAQGLQKAMCRATGKLKLTVLYAIYGRSRPEKGQKK